MHFGDGQTDRQTDEQMDSIDALSRSRCRDRRLNNSVNSYSCVVLYIINRDFSLHVMSTYSVLITNVHQPCVGFDNVAVGLLQLSVRGPAAVDSRAVTESAERRCSACV